MKISLLTGGDDPNYALPLTSALLNQRIHLDFIGNDAMQNSHIFTNNYVRYLNFRGDQDSYVNIIAKVLRIIKYYIRLFMYSLNTDSKLFHILWHNKFILFDRTLLIIYYKLLNKKVIFTAHNINQAARDGKDNFFNRISLKILYKTVDHIFVHTENMKNELVSQFNINENKITVVRFGINKFVPLTNLSVLKAKEHYKIKSNHKTILFFGRIANYKGVEHLLGSLSILIEIDVNYRLIIAGKVEKNANSYWIDMEKMIKRNDLHNYVTCKPEFIPDEMIEYYFKASDVLVLPYNSIYQSGPLFLSYYFGLPVIASDVGSFREDIIEGKTGFICKPKDPQDLAKKIHSYFESDLYKNLKGNRKIIMKWADDRYSWKNIGDVTNAVYQSML